MLIFFDFIQVYVFTTNRHLNLTLYFPLFGQGPTALAVVAGGGLFGHFTLIYPFSPLSPSLRETARYRLKYCLKGPKQATNPLAG